MTREEIENRIGLAVNAYYNIVADGNEIEKSNAYNDCFFELEFLKEIVENSGYNLNEFNFEF